MKVEPRAEHRWLDRLIGEWTTESECSMGPDQPPSRTRGTEVVRSLGGLWTIAEGEGAMPDGGIARSVMTLGFDPKTGRFIGTFIASMMTHLWSYDGALDESGRILELDAVGPSFIGEGNATYRDSIEFLDDDHRVLTSKLLDENGQWHQFMTAHYRRKK